MTETTASAASHADGGNRLNAARIKVCGLALVVYTLLRILNDVTAHVALDLLWAWIAFVVGFCALTFSARTADLPAAGRRLMRAAATFLILYCALEPLQIPYAAIPPGEPVTIFHGAARWIALLGAIAGWFRPAGVFLSAAVLWLARDLHTAITGFYFSSLDIRNVVETIAYGAVALALLYGVLLKRTDRWSVAGDAETLKAVAITAVAIGAGGHLANYFFSGMAKLALDGGVTSWLLGNRLDLGVPVAIERGTFPFTVSPTATTAVENFLRWTNPIFMPVSFLAQIAAIAAPWRRKWAMTLTATFDVFHVVVYLAFGLLFWKWIAINLIILVTLAVISDEDWRRYGRKACIATIVVSPLFFKVATLAWYDESNFASAYFEAELDDGTRMRIPNAYFGTASYQVSQHRIYAPGGAGHFNHSIWASYTNVADARAARECRPTTPNAPAQEKFGPVDAVKRYAAAHHAAVLDRINDHGIWNYYLIPHHHMPSPFVADPFYGVDKRRIETYFHVTESVCLDLQDGRLERRVLKRTEVPVWRKDAPKTD